MEEHVKVHPVRLFGIADMVLEKIEQRGGVLGLMELASGDEEASAEEGAAPTSMEIQEAVMLLIRLGFIERVDRAGGV